MKKFKTFFTVTAISLFTVVVLTLSVFVYFTEFKKTEVYLTATPDNEYTLILYQVGAPAFPYGAVKAQLKVLDSNGKTLDSKFFSVNNDGTSLKSGNLDGIRWYDDSVEINVKGADDQTSSTHILNIK